MRQESEKTGYCIEFFLEKGSEELLSHEIYALCGSGIWLEDAGDRIMVRAYPEDQDSFLNALQESGLVLAGVTVKKEEPKDYGELTRKYFRPITVEGLRIVAPWNNTRGKAPCIIIEPGMAFGTGRHESTRLMIRLMKDMDMKEKTVLDLGCGSAILSLYASLLGAKQATGVDNDQESVLSAEKNVLLNGVKNVRLLCSDLVDIHGQYDVVLANLDIRTFTSHGDKIADLVKKDGVLVASGILGREMKKFLALFPALLPEKIEAKNAWRGFRFRISHSTIGGSHVTARSLIN